MTSRGPLAAEHLAALKSTIDTALLCHPRVFAFRVDLRYPPAWNHGEDPGADVSRLFAAFKGRIKSSLVSRASVHGSSVHYVWCREETVPGLPHFHVLILLNRDAFFTLGSFELGRMNMFNRLVDSWASALGLPSLQAHPLVHIPENPSYEVRRDEPASIAALFYRCSYLCKIDTKPFGTGCRTFGTSRRLSFN